VEENGMTLGEFALIVKLIKRWRQRRKGKKMFKGKLTYAALAGIVAVQVGKLLGVEIAESEVSAITEAVLTGVAIYGRWRATRA
jgi:uncharacterized membrane protein